jgi:ankyrin repeat protein
LQHGLAMNTPNNEDQTLLHFAATMQFDEYEHISHLKCLLDLGYPIDILNSKQQTPLHIAIQHGMFFHALYFIYSGADLNAVDNEGRTIVDYANDFCSAGMEANDPYNLEYKQDLLQTLGDYKGS